MSAKYQLNKEDGSKIFKGFLIAVGGAIATYMMETIPNVNFGEYAPVAVAINSVLVNILRKFLASV
jgi:hypothetical protein